jgi:hypothetical protein
VSRLADRAKVIGAQYNGTANRESEKAPSIYDCLITVSGDDNAVAVRAASSKMTTEERKYARKEHSQL